MTTYHEYIHSEDRTIITREQDVTGLLEVSRAMERNEDIWKEGVKNCWAHYAMIPNIIIEKWKNEFGVDVFNKDHEKAWLKLVNQPEYRYLKTTTKMHRG